MGLKDITKEDFQSLVEQCSSYADILKHLGMARSKGNYGTLSNKFKEFIILSEFRIEKQITYKK